jgi:hypothetical protein
MRLLLVGKLVKLDLEISVMLKVKSPSVVITLKEEDGGVLFFSLLS